MDSESTCPEDDYSCPVCHDIYKDPIVLSCGHSFCKGCVQKCWRAKKMKECPVCKRIDLADPPCNFGLKRACETYLHNRRCQRAVKRKRTSTKSEILCSLHATEVEPEEFCVDCQQLVCIACLFSKKHKSHNFKTVQGIVPDVQESLQALKDKLEVFNTVKINYDLTTEHIHLQTQNTEKAIKKRFEKLHRFLREEEEARICALREERQQKIEMVKEKIDGLNRDMATISNTIQSTEEDLRAQRISLHNYKTTVDRLLQFTLQQNPQLDPGALIDQAKHLGNLTFRVWDQMKDIVSYAPVILDPNTAGTNCILSDEMTRVSIGQSQQLPDNPERIDYGSFILGSESFKSGTRIWEVEVGDNADWEVGVLPDTYNRKGDIEGYSWSIELMDGNKYTAYEAEFTESLSLLHKPQRIRVHLDWNEGKLSFSDPDTDTHIHTFTHTFTSEDTAREVQHNTGQLG